MKSEQGNAYERVKYRKTENTRLFYVTMDTIFCLFEQKIVQLFIN